jgi:hypothetical protein
VGSSDESKNESEPRDPEFTNPLGLAFLNLFGIPTGWAEDNASFGITGNVGAPGASTFAPRLFTPDMFNRLTDQLDPVPMSEFERMARQGVQGADNAFGSAMGLFQNSLFPAVGRAASGKPTDIQPIIDQQMRMFRNQIMPEISNQFGFLGGGGQNQLTGDFGESLARAGGDIATNLGALRFQAEESAADRMLQALQFGGNIGTGFANLGAQRAAFPAALGSDIFALSQQNFDQQLLQRPGGQLLNFFNNLMGVTQPDPLLLGNISSGSRDAFSIL